MMRRGDQPPHRASSTELLFKIESDSAHHCNLRGIASVPELKNSPSMEQNTHSNSLGTVFTESET